MDEPLGGEDGEGGGAVQKPRRRRRPEPTPVARAVGLLSRREHSARELRMKLQARGLAEAEAAQAVERVREAGWQDDARFAEMLIRSRAGQGYGPHRIVAELKVHGVAGEVADAAMRESVEDWAALARRLVERRHGRGHLDAAARRKAAEMLYRRGFSGEQVGQACGGGDPGGEIA